MSRASYNAIRIAKQLGYDRRDSTILSRLELAKTESEIARIMKTARSMEPDK